MIGMTDMDDGLKLSCISQMCSALEQVGTLLPERQACGHFTLFVNHAAQTSSMERIFHPVISIDLGKMRLDKLKWHPSYSIYKTHCLLKSNAISSYKIREDVDLKSLDENSKVILGGAIKAGPNDAYAMGFAGMTEHGDEAMVVMAALKLKWIDVERAKQVLTISDNSLLKKLLE